MEYAGKGSLQYVLRSYRLPWSDIPEERYSPYANMPPVKKLTARDLIVFAVNVAAGMDFISSKEVRTPVSAWPERVLCQPNRFSVFPAVSLLGVPVILERDPVKQVSSV